MQALILSALLCGQVPPNAEAPRWAPDLYGSHDLGLWLGDRFLGRWVTATKQYLPYDGEQYGPPCLLPPDAPQVRLYQTAPPPLAYRPVFFGGGCANGRCGR